MGRHSSYDSRYPERVTLSDGGEVTLRLLDRDDKELLRRGFERLSEVSRYHRFFAGKSSLLESELRYLTEIDGDRHVALVALDGESGEGIAVARAVRLPDERTIYEVAMTVVDQHQRRGLGALLLARLIAATAERGARALRFCVLPSNTSMRALLARAPLRLSVAVDDGVLIYDAALDGERAGEHAGL